MNRRYAPITTVLAGIALFGSGPALFGQVAYQVLRSFAVTNAVSCAANLIQGNDGALYGATYYGGVNGLGSVFRVNSDGTGYTNLYSFSGTNGDGAFPQCSLVQGQDGALYGTTFSGGSNLYYGTVFRLNTNGGGYTNIYSFTGATNNGAYPLAGLVQGSDGALYGTTYYGGISNSGTIFKLNTDGTAYSLLRNFTGGNSDGAYPQAPLLQGSDGALYGTTYAGGSNALGTVFKLSTTGSGYTNLHSFRGTNDGARPMAGLLQYQNVLFGTALAGGAANDGTVFRLNPDGTAFTNLYAFSGPDGTSPQTGLVVWTNGVLFGTTGPEIQFNSVEANGTVFQINQDGSAFATDTTFGPGSQGQPQGILLASDGTFYVTTATSSTNPNLDGQVLQLSWDGSQWNLNNLFNGFISPGGDGQTPVGLLVGNDGALYGTTDAGGSSNLGTVFRMNQDASGYQILRSFTGKASDGAVPQAGLLQASDGALYGTTTAGGSNNLGAVFKMSTNGTSYTNLHSFSSAVTNGAQPQSLLLQGADGSLYGTTLSGGANATGTVFRITTTGGYTNLHSFAANGVDGLQPSGPLWQGVDGYLYGTALAGGSGNLGTVFKLSTNGTGYTNLHVFRGVAADGASPEGGVIQGVDGFLYGTTYSGGVSNLGAVFKMATNGTGYTNLHSFTEFNGEGAYPVAGVIQGADGRIYGSATSGGILPAGNGILFSLNTNGSGYSNLYSFQYSQNFSGVNNADGYAPGPLVQAPAGAFYGITSAGGGGSYGTIYTLMVSAARPLELAAVVTTNITNASGTINFTARVTVTNGGPVAASPLRLRVLAKAGDSVANRTPNAGALPADQVLGIYNLPSPVSAGGANVMLITNVCPAPIAINPVGLGFGWGVFVLLEEQVGPDWLFEGDAFLLYSVWPTVGGLQGSGGVILLTDPAESAGPVSLNSVTISGPANGIVNSGTTASFSATAYFNDGLNVAFTNTVWASYPLTNITNGYFQPGNVTTNTPVTVTCYFNFAGTNYSTSTNITVLAPDIITTSSSPPGSGTTSGGGSYTNGQSVTVSATPISSCYTFQNWTSNGVVVSSSTLYTFTAGTNATFTANFVLNTYPVKVNITPAGAGTVSLGATYSTNFSLSTNCGASLSLSAAANHDWEFTGWTINLGGVVSSNNNASLLLTVATNTTLQANFLAVVQVTVQASPSNAATTFGSGLYVPGQRTNISVSANSGWNFVNWSDSATTNLMRTITVSASDKTYTAFFMPTNLVLGLGSPLRGPNGFNLLLSAPIGGSYRVDVSTNLPAWQVLTNLTTTSSPYPFSDPATNGRQRLYRAAWVP